MGGWKYQISKLVDIANTYWWLKIANITGTCGRLTKQKRRNVENSKIQELANGKHLMWEIAKNQNSRNNKHRLRNTYGRLRLAK